ncbi:unnamed protein product [Ceutorhynchus assimilis]|uniref:Mab-21-like HhH/H2TH-like domain-containing protein n=1 Tax=Ceutorhynchus assimilis TaxID=467358 RepID=A0A9N9Q9C8_9CUCU|nr:unnamed protein product [Ceutorhynchus assimilis]
MMGSDCSKRSSQKNISQREFMSPNMAPRSYGGLNDGDIRVQSVVRDDFMATNVIKMELEENVQAFLLNNIIMGVHFFPDHKEVINRLQHVPSTPEEKEMSKTLLKDETMECTYPDAILEEVNKNIIFRTMDEYSKSESLLSKRIYVINDLIEVVSSNEIPQYLSIDKPCYQVKIEPSSKKGYVKMTQVENNSAILQAREYDENYEPTPGPSTRSDSDYDYSTITDLRTPKPIEVDTNTERRDTLPESCFTHKKIKQFPMKSLGDEDDDDEMNLDYLANLNEEDFFRVIVYINSYGFMNYFQNVLFSTSLGKSLGFNEDAICTAKAIPGKIFCDDLDIETNVYKSFEIIPAVSIPWPDDQTIEFVYREDRPTIFDTRTGTKYQWPTTGPASMIEDIRNMTAVLVPKGYAKKKGFNKNSNLEWEINFPKAERYLEARMSHAQMKCMLILFTLLRTYITPVTKQNGLLPEHIRSHMYWECETDYRNWPEHRLGTKILRVIKDLQMRLFEGSLPDFFIKDRDLFENIPKKYLNYAQKILLQILSNPVPFFIKALKNVRYTSGKFYPPLDFKELYDGIRSKSGAVLVNPNLGMQSLPQLKKRLYRDPEQQMKHIKYLKKKEQIIRDRIKQKEEEEKSKEINVFEINDDNDIDLEESIDKELDIWKTKAIIVIFIKHFIEIARKSSILSTAEQALFYLKQASYLAKILEDTAAAFVEEMGEYRQIIAAEEARVKMKSVRTYSSTEEKPPTPVRNSISFQYNEINQQLKSGSIKLNNLQASYVNGMQPVQPVPPAMRNLKPAQRSESYKQNGQNAKRKNVAFAE